jgi:hypothetical protein
MFEFISLELDTDYIRRVARRGRARASVRYRSPHGLRHVLSRRAMAIRFDAPKVIDRFNLSKLDDIRTAQFYAALGLAVGSPKERRAAAATGGKPSDEVFEQQLRRCENNFMRWEYFRGYEDDRHAYDAWFLGDECGSVFHADGANETGVVMTHSSICAANERASPALVDAIEAAWQAARGEFEPDEHAEYWADYQFKLGREIEEGDDEW